MTEQEKYAELVKSYEPTELLSIFANVAARVDRDYRDEIAREMVDTLKAELLSRLS